MSCGTCAIQAGNAMQDATGVPAGASQSEHPRCPYCNAFIASEGANCHNPACPGTTGGEMPALALSRANGPAEATRTAAAPSPPPPEEETRRLTPRQAKEVVRDALDRLGLPYTRLTARTVDFTDLARAKPVFVRIHGWRPSGKWQDLQALARRYGFCIETD